MNKRRTRPSPSPSSNVRRDSPFHSFHVSHRPSPLSHTHTQSGIPTFRGAGGLWRSFQAQQLATPSAFKANPGLVWEFYEYRRQVVSKCSPNRGHFALTALQQQLAKQGKEVHIITQNIDRLHQLSGSENVLELHGSLWLLKTIDHPGFLEENDPHTGQSLVWEDRRVPLAPCFVGKCQPDALAARSNSDIPLADLPHTDTHTSADVNDNNKRIKRKLLRPAVVWFGEGLDDRVLNKAHSLLAACDLLLVVGTSSVVYPAAAFAPLVAEAGKPVIEINLEATENSSVCEMAIQGKAGEVLPTLLGVEEEVREAMEVGVGGDGGKEEGEKKGKA